MSRKHLSILSIVLSAALVAQAMFAVDHVHFSLTEELECVACKVSSSDEMAIAPRALVEISLSGEVPETPVAGVVATTLPGHRARSPPA